MSQRIFPSRRQRDGTYTTKIGDRKLYDIGAMRKVMDNAFEKRKKADREMFKFETAFLEDATRISNMAKVVRTSTRSNTLDFDPDRSTRRFHASIRPQDRMFSRTSFTSPLYAPGQPHHRELLKLLNSNLDTQFSLMSPPNRGDTPDEYGMDYTLTTPRQARPSEYEQTDDDEDFHDVDSMLDDAVSIGTAQDDMDGNRFDVDIDDYNDDSNSGVFATSSSSRRNSNRMRMSSGSISPGLLNSRKRISNLDLDYPARSKKSSKRSGR